MPVQLTKDSFRKVILHSGLVSADRLAEIESEHTPDTSTAEALSNLLVSLGEVTAWQAKKLLQAKHRGFHLGPYQLQSKLARGGMSTIYSARKRPSRQPRETDKGAACESSAADNSGSATDLEDGEECVLKVLPPARVSEASYLPRFQREARIACGLEHPNVVRVFGLHCESDGKCDVHFMVMERLFGENLSEKVNREGRLPIRLAAQLIQQAAQGLAYSHQAGLVHRDVKPANFILTTDNVIKVLDLGLASIDCPDEEELTRQYDERVLGTADYLSPEQAVDSHKADSRSDIYSLGCTLYFLLTGHPPFPDGLLAQRILAHQNQQPVCITKKRPDVPSEFQVILEGMMVKDRRLRTQTAELVAEQLSEWLEATVDDERLDQVPENPETDSTTEAVNQSAPTKTQNDTQPLKPQTDHTTEDSGALSGIYTPEFEVFLQKLDEESGIRSVVDSTTREQQIRSMSQIRMTEEDDH